MPEGFGVSDDDLWKATKSQDLDTRADALRRDSLHSSGI